MKLETLSLGNAAQQITNLIGCPVTLYPLKLIKQMKNETFYKWSLIG